MNGNPIECKPNAQNGIRLLRILYQEEKLTKRELSQRMGMSLPTVQLYLKQLADEGFLMESGTAISSGGRKAHTLSLSKNARIAVGIEITAFHYKLVLINLRDEVLYNKRIACAFEDTPHYWKRIAEEAQKFLRTAGFHAEQVLGVGVALPGIVDKEAQILRVSTSLHLENLALNLLADQLPWPILLENDANAAGLAELGRIEQLEDAVYISLSKGVGGAILINHQVYQGSRFHAGELGHFTLIPGGKPCNCGGRGCLESYCSALALCDDSRELDQFFYRVRTGNAEANARLEQYLRHLALAIHNLHTIFDTDLILGGDLVPYLENYLAELYQQVHLLGNSANTHPFHIRISKFLDYSPAVGAAVLVTRQFWQE